MHELIRTFAVQSLAPQLAEPVRTAALRRLVTDYLASADAADRVLTPHRFRPDLEPHSGPAPQTFSDPAEAVAWCAEEQANLVAACRLAGAEDWSVACWQLAYVLRGYFFLAKAWDVWAETHRLALAAARAARDEWAEAATAANLGLALLERGHVRAAQELYHQSLAVHRRIGDAVGEAGVLGHQAWAAYCLRDYRACVELATAALAIYERKGIERNRAITLRTLALAESRLGRSEDAERHLQDALTTFVGLVLPLDAAMVCNALGQIHADRGDEGAARRWYAQAVELGKKCGSRYEQACGYEGLAAIAVGAGRRRVAHRFALRALVRFDALGAPDAGRVRAVFHLRRPPGSGLRPAASGDGTDERGW